jgi:hypothetical protein
MVSTLRDGKVAGWQIYEDTAREFRDPRLTPAGPLLPARAPVRPNGHSSW